MLQFYHISGTYKMKKLDLQEEGFNPEIVKDRLYYLTSKGVYELLTTDIYHEILAEKIRFWIVAKYQNIVLLDSFWYTGSDSCGNYND